MSIIEPAASDALKKEIVAVLHRIAETLVDIPFEERGYVLLLAAHIAMSNEGKNAERMRATFDGVIKYFATRGSKPEVS